MKKNVNEFLEVYGDKLKYTLATFYYGHIDDLPPRIVLGQVVIDLFNPPWKEFPKETPMSFEYFYR